MSHETLVMTAREPKRPAQQQAVDLSKADNSLLQRGRPLWMELLWYFLGSPLLRTAWLPSSGLKRQVLRLFGATVGEGVYIKPGLRVKFPWFLDIGDHVWLGEEVWIDNLAQVRIGSHSCVSQGVYLCTGNHDWSSFNMKLFHAPITLLEGSWVGARCVVGPNVTVGRLAVATAGSVVVRSIPGGEIHSGNPASFVKHRVIREATEQELAAANGKRTR